jgi:hypothetical protein
MLLFITLKEEGPDSAIEIYKKYEFVKSVDPTMLRRLEELKKYISKGITLSSKELVLVLSPITEFKPDQLD